MSLVLLINPLHGSLPIALGQIGINKLSIRCSSSTCSPLLWIIPRLLSSCSYLETESSSTRCRSSDTDATRWFWSSHQKGLTSLSKHKRASYSTGSTTYLETLTPIPSLPRRPQSLADFLLHLQTVQQGGVCGRTGCNKLRARPPLLEQGHYPSRLPKVLEASIAIRLR